METEHPYNFSARQCIREMLSAKGSVNKILPILPKLINPLRNALGTKDDKMFLDTLDITRLVT
jgi:hypothetical protein